MSENPKEKKMSEQVPIPSAEEMRQEHTEKAAAADFLGELAASQPSRFGSHEFQDEKGNRIALVPGAAGRVERTTKGPGGTYISVPTEALSPLKDAAEASKRRLAESDAKASEVVTQNLDKFIPEAQENMKQEMDGEQNKAA